MLSTNPSSSSPSANPNHPNALSMASCPSSSSSTTSFLPTSSLPLDLKIKTNSKFMMATPVFLAHQHPMDTSHHDPSLSLPSTHPIIATSSSELDAKHLSRKFVFCKLKNEPQLPPNFEAATLSKLLDAVNAIFQQRSPGISLENLYRACETLCRYKFGDTVYEKLSLALAEHCRSHVPKIMAFVSTYTTQPSQFLDQLLKCWRMYSESLKLICQIFMFLDRAHILPTGKTGLWDLGLQLFRKHVLAFPSDATSASSPPLEPSAAPPIVSQPSVSSFAAASSSSSSSTSTTTAMATSTSPSTSPSLTVRSELGLHTVQALVRLINVYRSVYFPPTEPASSLYKKYTLHPIESLEHIQPETSTMISECASMLQTLKIYTVHFAPLLLEHSLEFYVHLLQTWLGPSYAAQTISTSITPDIYLTLCNGAFALEKWIVHILPDPCETNLIAQVLKELVLTPHVFLLSGLPLWLASPPNLGALTSLYMFFKSVDLLPVLRTNYTQWLVAQGQQMFTGDPLHTVNQLLKLKSNMDAVLTCFEQHEMFLSATKEAFFKFMNMPQHRPAESIAKFVDHQLRSRKTLDEAEMEHVLDQVILLFKHLQGKDIFAAFYKGLLAKRLLSGKTTSVDAERSMLVRLRNECGKEFTENLEKMLGDIELSKELSAAFHESKYYFDITMDFSVTVCKDTVWPAANVTHPPLPLVLPPILQRAMERFNEFYVHQYSGRQLTWQHETGQMVLRAPVWHSKELTTPLLQGLVLLAFNHQETYTHAQLQACTGIQDPEVFMRVLHSLVIGKTKFLRCHPPNATLSEHTQFQLVPELNTTKVRVTVHSLLPKDLADLEDQKTNAMVHEDRVAILDATIVRVLKIRKKITHAALFSEVLNLCKFPVESTSFKKRVENLMEREFLEREESQVNMYKYIA